MMLNAASDTDLRKSLLDEAPRAFAPNPAGVPSLPDREAFLRRLDMSIRMAERQRSSFAVMLLDLGPTEDPLSGLAAAAAALRITVRLTDTVAWLEGRQFAVLLNVANEEGATRVGGKIFEALGEALGEAAGREVRAGMALYPDHGKSGDQLLRAVNGALYQASRGHKGIVMAVLAEGVLPEVRETLGQRFGMAIEQNEFVLRFQPVVNLVSGLPVGAEALARWRHPELGLLPPAEFMHLATHESALEGLSLRLLDQALRQIRNWRERGVALSLSLNFAPVLLAREGLDQLILARLQAQGLSPECLTLELRDEGLAALSASALRVLFSLASAGVCLAIDDFGRGTGSLLALRDLPVQEFKIDAAFVSKVCHSEADAAIVATLVSLGRRLGKTVIAKGIETEEVRQKLRSLGCEYGQGFCFAQALPAQELEDWRDQRMAADGARQTLI
ncbi:GGDEF domain-containing phosphodiesterase [Uliginosibacterium aquaticum]|uniref:EAL domain-containing protein n=1 Tax=Uliginosibacterium aquaticum TaxID=2731212 RepID=A0ABX2IFZ7_9RHOO|nr:GGDEF domain-containing phosphodiesterase [Uliginosibacterium aquaticum]NSL53907.1 EAL domain-containing protein [Uliginosibacterium aquaticum]